MRFRNRADAGRKLAAALLRYKSQRPIVLALLRGGVPVAAEVAAALGSPLDIVLVRKIGAPMQPEVAIGAVVDGGDPIVIHNPEVERLTHTTPEQFQALCEKELAEIERRRRCFLGNRAPIDPKGRVVIVIDDGIATGATMRAALQATRMRKPTKLVLAVPVAPTDTLQDLRQEVDDVVCLTNLEPFGAVGYFYDDFRQLTDEDVTDVLARFHLAPAPRDEHPEIDKAELHHIAGDIDDAKTAQILRLQPSRADVEIASICARGESDILCNTGQVLDGKAAVIFDILTRDDEEALRRNA